MIFYETFLIDKDHLSLITGYDGTKKCSTLNGEINGPLMNKAREDRQNEMYIYCKYIGIIVFALFIRS